jgi:hypothetical protein
VAVSACLINFNKHLMSPTVFPYAVALTYLYCSVPFLQMMKEFNVVLVFLCGLVLAVEKFDLNLVAVLAIVTLGCVLSVHGEMKFSALGFALQAGCQVSEVIKIMKQQIVTQGQKLDPLTTVMILSPQCLLVLSMAMPFVWNPAILTSIQNHWPLLLLNCGNALLLNIVVASVLRYASGLTMVITGVVKDITIVCVASLLFSAEVSPQQCIGFVIAVFGVMVYSVVRSTKETVSEHGVVLTVAHMLLRWPLPKAKSEGCV